jgi:hypothetical protein
MRQAAHLIVGSHTSYSALTLLILGDVLPKTMFALVPNMSVSAV